MKIIELKCKKCGAKLEMDSSRDSIFCTYCGTENFIDDEASKIRRIEDVKLESRKKNHEQDLKEQQEKEELEYQNSFKNSKLKKWIIVILCFTVLATIMSFVNNSILSGIIAAIQSGLLIGSLLMGLHAIKEPFKYCHRIMAYVAFALILIFGRTYNPSESYSSNKCEDLKWDNIYMHEVIPAPEKLKGEIHINTKEDLSIDICDAKESDYYDYKAKVTKAGFVIDEDIGTTTYSAYNEDGYKIRFYYYESGKELSITAEAPEEKKVLSWPTTGLATKLPKPTSATGYVSYDSSSSFSAYITDTSKEDYEAYVNKCQSLGYTVDYTKSDYGYTAKDKNNYKIEVTYQGQDTMYIHIEKVEETKEEPKEEPKKEEEKKEEPAKEEPKKEEEKKEEAPKKTTPVSWAKADKWAIDELSKANELGVIPETFEAKDFTAPITRKDFAAVAVKLYEALTNKAAKAAEKNPFTDTKDEYVLKAYALEITKGTSDTEFSPDAQITREQMATMLTRALTTAGIKAEANMAEASLFADDGEMSSWAKDSVYFMSQKGIIKGIGENKFGAKDTSTIEQALMIAERSVLAFEKK